MNVKRIIYDMKRRHGEQIQVHHVVTTNHAATGVQTVVSEDYTIVRQAIVDQVTVTRMTHYLQAQDKFKEGGFYEVGDLLILIDKNDLAIVTADYTVIYKNERYDIKSVSQFLDLHLLKIRKVQSQEKLTIQERGNAIALTQTVGYVI